MSVLVLKKSNFEDEVMASDKPVLIDFYADWCGPCKMVSPIVDEIAEENENYKVCKVNVDDEPQLASAFNVQSIPMLVVIRNGKIINSSVGAKPKDQILKMFE